MSEQRRRRRAALVPPAALALALLLAACSSGAPTPGATSPVASPPAQGGSAASPAAGTGGGAQASGSSQFSPALQALIQAANQEGSLTFADVNPQAQMQKVFDAFNQRFGTHINIQIATLRSADIPTRLQQEAAAGKVTIDVVHPSSSLVFGLKSQNADVFDTYDYAGTFGNTLAGLDQATARVPQNVQGQALEYQDLVELVAYNTNLVTGSDIPQSWNDLLDPRWSGGKLAVDPQGSSTYQLDTEWTDQQVLDFSQKLAAQDPDWVSGEPAIAQAIARGDALVGMTSPTNVEDLQNAGQPIAIAHTEFVSGQQQLLFPVKGSPHINAARLFAAWMATEGMQVETEDGIATERVWPDSNSWASNELNQLGIKVDMLVSPDDVERADNLRVEIAKEYRQLGAGGGGGGGQ